MGQKNKKVQTTPTLSEYLAQRAQQVRDSAANVYALKDMPEVPIIPEQNVFSKGLAWLGLSDGTTEDNQQMQIGLKATNGWKPYTLDDILANAARIEQQKRAMEDRLNNVFTLSNDATSIANGRPQNTHLERKAVEGARAHRAWEEEHPNLTAWGNTLSAVPFAVAAAPAILAGGEALASTAVGQSIISGASRVTSTPIVQKAWPWINAAGTLTMGVHGVSNIANGTFTPLTALELAPMTQGYKVGKNAIQGGRRFLQNVGDRYQGMKDAAEYTANNTIKGTNAMDVTNYIWKNRQGPQASGIIAPYKDIAAFMKKSDGSTTAVTTAGGHQTINAHLGGLHYGDKPWELNPMGRTERMWLGEYMETTPQGTIFGEVGSTNNFAEQYNGVTPSWSRAIKDAILNKRETNNPYWKDFEEGIKARMAGAKGDEEVIDYYTNLLDNNNPLSVDSYSMMLNMAKKGKYDLRYDSSPMGLFNSQGVREKEFFNSLSELSPKEKVKAINDWLVKFNPEARPAYLKDGEVVIPRPLLKKKTKPKNTWLRK